MPQACDEGHVCLFRGSFVLLLVHFLSCCHPCELITTEFWGFSCGPVGRMFHVHEVRRLPRRRFRAVLLRPSKHSAWWVGHGLDKRNYGSIPLTLPFSKLAIPAMGLTQPSTRIQWVPGV
jgi:hypothetical protein